LKKQGLSPLQRNYACRYGEIDLIMTLANWLVFVEVKFRSNSLRFGGGLGAITKSKKRRLVLTARDFLFRHPRTNCFCRFDVVIVSGSLKKPEYQWIQSAFDEDGYWLGP